VYRRFEYHGLEEVDGVSICRIYRYGYINDKEVGLHTVKEWEDIPTETIIPGVDRLLFGRYKCPTVNRDNINSPQGVPITYGLDTAVQKAKDSYVRFNEEYRRKQTKIFARKDLFTKDSDKGVIIPDKAVYQTVAGDMDGQLPIKEFSPDLRYDGLKGGVDLNFKMLELFCGLSAGILTDVQSDLATATAIRASMNNSFAFIGTMRKVIESGTDDLIYAISMLYNANSQNGTIGDYEVSYRWDYQMMENSTETFQQYLQAYGIGEIKKGEIRSWIKGIPIDQAVEELEEVELDNEDVAI
jgi:A118 family predicted phage portal protein